MNLVFDSSEERETVLAVLKGLGFKTMTALVNTPPNLLQGALVSKGMGLGLRQELLGKIAAAKDLIKDPAGMFEKYGFFFFFFFFFFFC